MSSSKPAKPRAKTRKIGRLLVIGGNEDKDEDRMEILPYFVKLCGGRRARILVCGSPSKTPGQKERVYRRLFEKIGVREVTEASIRTRQEAESEDTLAALQRATGVFFTGGDQLRLTSLIAGTPFGLGVRDGLWTKGLIVAGTSAGAAAMSSTMVIGGNDRGTVRRQDVRLAPGLGYWRDATIDTHFAQRGRISRLLTIFAENPQILGIGLDEDTAIDVSPGKDFHVVGTGAAFVFDGAVTHSNAPEVEDKEVIAMTDALVHVLPSGYGFDLRHKRPILPGGRRVPQRKPQS
jgi:cyanophycinase